MVNKLAHLVIEGTTYDIQDEELTSKFDDMTIELSLSNDYIITATLKDGNNTTLSTATIDLPSENSLVSLDYDNTTNEIIGIYRDDTVTVPHRIRVELDNLQEKLTAGQNISIINNTVSLLGLGEASTEAVTGIATLDSGGKVPSSQLPSYVDDVLEYSTLQSFPEAGETGKIYVALDTNLTYRWSGSVYVEISQSLALGETSSTAYRGDRGKTAYDHAAAKGSAYQSGLYKITTNSEGHVISATVVQKSDITALGIPAQDTQPNNGKLTLMVNNDQSTKVEFTANDNTDKTFNVTQPIYDKAIEIVNNQVSVKYADKQWDISRDYNNKLFINGKFVKQVEDLDSYTDAPDGEIVEYIGETNSNYTNGYFYKRIAGGSTAEYETITIPPNKTYITYHFPDNTEETGYEVSEELSVEQAQWYYSYISSVTSSDGGTYTSTDYEKWRIFIPIAKVGDEITYNGQHKGVIESLYIEISFPNTGTYNLNFFDEIINDYGYFSSPSLEDAIESYKNLCDQNNLQYGQYSNTYITVKGVNAVIENKHYKIFASGSSGGYGSNAAIQLISVNGNRLFLESCSYIQDLTHLVSNEIRQNVSITLKQDGTTTEYVDNHLYFYNNPKYNSPTTATLGTTTEEITITVPILYDEYGQLLDDIVVIPPSWQRIDVQPNTTSSLINDAGFITALVNNLTNYYTKSEINNLLSQLETNIDWKEAVNTYADIATTYPNPQDGWTVNVKDTDYTYRWDGTNWIAISANAIPLATPTTPNTQGVNGLMSTVDKTKLDGIQAGAEVNIQSDWSQGNINADDYIKNKPVIPTITFRQWNTTE